jgi:hypothetical protein
VQSFFSSEIAFLKREMIKNNTAVEIFAKKKSSLANRIDDARVSPTALARLGGFQILFKLKRDWVGKNCDFRVQIKSLSHVHIILLNFIRI